MKKLYYILFFQMVLAIGALAQPVLNSVNIYAKYSVAADSFSVFANPSVTGGPIASLPLGSSQITIVFENIFSITGGTSATVKSFNGGTWTSQDFAIGSSAPNLKYLTFISNGAAIPNVTNNTPIKLFEFKIVTGGGNCQGKLRPYVNGTDPTDPNGAGGDFSSVVNVGVTDYFSTFNDPVLKTCTELSLLPVNFLGFDAQQIGNDAILTWNVSAETEKTGYYELERSTNGRIFEKIARIEKTKSTSGTNQYSYSDKNVTALSVPEIFYRVKQIDIDNKFVYSRVKSLSLISKGGHLSLSPNPASDFSILSIEMNVEERSVVSIIDQYGKLVYKQNITLFSGMNRLKLPVMNLASGSYKVSIQSNNSNRVLKLLKQ